MNVYSIEDLTTFVEVMPLNQINFQTVRSFVGATKTNEIKQVQEIISKSQKHTCSHCKKTQENSRFTIVPSCHMVEPAGVIQITGLKPLCTDCASMHGILLQSIKENKKYTKLNSWKVIVKCFKDFGGCSTSDISDTLDAMFDQAIKLNNTSFKWDLQYLYRRNMVNAPFVDIVVDESDEDEKDVMSQKIREAGFIQAETDDDDYDDEEAAAEHYDDVGMDADAGSM